MSFELTTALNPGDLGVEEIPRARITKFTHDSVLKRIVINLQYGKEVGGIWVPLQTPIAYPTVVVYQGVEYAELVGGNLDTYNAVKNSTYAQLLADGKIPPGTVV